VALATALEALIRAPERRQAMGLLGRRRILEQFAFEAGIAKLAQRFSLGVAQREAA